jgi:hypothetical protein
MSARSSPACKLPISAISAAATRLPWLLCRAAAVYIRRTDAGQAFMDVMRKFIAVKAEREGFWGLDQAALYCASRYCADRAGLRFLELSHALGFTLDRFARSASSDTEKQGLRKLAKAASEAVA